MINKRKKITYFLTLLILFLFLFLFIISSLFIIIIYTTRRKKPNDRNERFLLSEINPMNNKTNYGFVRLKTKLSEDEYFSTFNPYTKSTIIISNFFNDEYECTGSCYCTQTTQTTEKKNRKTITSSTNILTKGLFVVFTSISIQMAINIAKDSFQNSCEEQFSNICESKTIKSEVEECLILDPTTEEFTISTNEKQKQKQNLKKKTYSCFGHCEPNLLHIGTAFVTPEQYVDAHKKFGKDCTVVERTAIVSVRVEENGFDFDSFSSSLVYTKHKFYKETLDPFCRKMSTIKIYGEEVPVCTGYGLREIFSNIRCSILESEKKKLKEI